VVLSVELVTKLAATSRNQPITGSTEQVGNR